MNNLIRVSRTNMQWSLVLRSAPLRKYSEDDKDSTKKGNEAKSNEALEKLNLLLQKMIKEPLKSDKPALNLSKPKILQKIEEKEQKPNVTAAVKDVAECLGGDAKQTESELLTRLLVDKQANTMDNLSEIFRGMKIDRTTKPVELRSQQVRKTLNQERSRRQDREASRQKQRFMIPPQKIEKIDLNGGESLGIFSSNTDIYSSGPQTSTWDNLLECDKKLAVTHPPKNYFQEMILWTEQGKVWKFPINNELGLDEEQDVYFADHVFLERHIDPWCPPRGPIRHFMELVCVGLSKNHHLSVVAKRQHLEWYRDYFESKQELLREIGASLNQNQNE